ncbi:MAG: phosphoglucosamine mutase [Actinomycetota bacterium]|nr:phosphoglucosamine mutase [Actinomycetota bacterium]
MTLRFGTDGMRGLANAELTPELVLALGRAAARALAADRVVLGRDTRISGGLIESALCAGLTAEGVDVTVLGVCPTPAVAWTAAFLGCPGAVISASHNPFGDNGVKFFAAGGTKLSDDIEDAIEAELERVLADGVPGITDDTRRGPTGDGVGRVVHDGSAITGWEDAIVASVDGRSLAGLSVVVDCANGAASTCAPEVLARLGAVAEVVCAEPDGTNINAGCGSTYLDRVRSAVLASGADLGVAFDGDADRVLFVDARGEMIDGDQLIGMLAIDRKARGVLVGDTVVVTVMANLGFRQGMARHGIAIRETPVGDRHVLAALESGGWTLGGEQSGHVILRDLATTGDGLLTAVHVLDLVARSGRTLRDLADDAMTRLPQVLVNVPTTRRDPAIVEAMGPAIEKVQRRLGEHGRVLIRPSGTEPLVRVMVEADEHDTAAAAADELVEVVQQLTG